MQFRIWGKGSGDGNTLLHDLLLKVFFGRLFWQAATSLATFIGIRHNSLATSLTFQYFEYQTKSGDISPLFLYRNSVCKNHLPISICTYNTHTLLIRRTLQTKPYKYFWNTYIYKYNIKIQSPCLMKFYYGTIHRYNDYDMNNMILSGIEYRTNTTDNDLFYCK